MKGSQLAKLMELDAAQSRRLGLALKAGPLRGIAMGMAHSGDSWFWLIAFGLVLLVGNPYWRERALVMGAGIITTAVLVMSLKFTIRRRRPDGEWGNIYRKADPHSFPSGHAARAFLLAVLALGMGPPWLAIVLVIWAPLVPLARVALGVHYLSDIVAGAVLGTLIGLVILSLFWS